MFLNTLYHLPTEEKHHHPQLPPLNPSPLLCDSLAQISGSAAKDGYGLLYQPDCESMVEVEVHISLQTKPQYLIVVQDSILRVHHWIDYNK